MRKTLVLVDLDGTIDAYPFEMQATLSALRTNGHQVYVVTGVTGDAATPDVVEAKRAYLRTLGLSACYDRLVIVAAPDGNVAARKAAFAVAVGADMAIDNNIDNARAYADAGVALVLLTWQTRTSFNVASRDA